MNKHHKHTIETANQALIDKGVADFLQIVSIDTATGNVAVKDKTFGEYNTDLKSLCPSMSVPLHKKRRHLNKVKSTKNKYIGTSIKGMTITNVFYGPDHGYKNRSFYLEYLNTCGHPGITTMTTLVRHKKTTQCATCSKVTHGARSVKNGERIKRTATYTHWQRIRKTLPIKYQEYSIFRDAAGDKPKGKAEIRIVDDIPVWVELSISDDLEISLIATAIRQAFRHSKIYKNALKQASVETDTTTKYRCAMCKNLFILSKVQVDHITPIANVDGSPILKDNLIDSIWTDKIQVLDRICHAKKSSLENAARRENKKGNTRNVNKKRK